MIDRSKKTTKNPNERKEASAPIDCGNGYGALLGSGGNEGIVGGNDGTDAGKATSKATRGSTLSATNSVLAACMCGFRQLLTAHSQSRAPVQGATFKPKTPKTVNKTVDPKTTTTATPKGSVSASGWFSWPKLCWPKVLCIICTCLIAASGGAFAYFSHGSDSLLPSIVVPDATALPTETGRGPLFAQFNPAPGPVVPDVVQDPNWLIATSGFCSHLNVVMNERDVEASETEGDMAGDFVADISFNYYPQTAVKFTDFPYHKANTIEGDQNEADALVSPAWDHKNIALLEPTSTCSADEQTSQAWGISVFKVKEHRACTVDETEWEGHPCVHYTGYVSAETSNFVNVNEERFVCKLFVDSSVPGYAVAPPCQLSEEYPGHYISGYCSRDSGRRGTPGVPDPATGHIVEDDLLEALRQVLFHPGCNGITREHPDSPMYPNKYTGRSQNVPQWSYNRNDASWVVDASKCPSPPPKYDGCDCCCCGPRCDNCFPTCADTDIYNCDWCY